MAQNELSVLSVLIVLYDIFVLIRKRFNSSLPKTTFTLTDHRLQAYNANQFNTGFAKRFHRGCSELSYLVFTCCFCATSETHV